MVARRFSFSGILDGEPPTIFSEAKMAVRQRLSFNRVLTREDSDHVTVNSTDGSPYILKQDVVPGIQMLALRVLSDSKTARLKVTSAAGTDQILPVSGSMLWESPNAADALTEIKIVTDGLDVDLEYFVAGN